MIVKLFKFYSLFKKIYQKSTYTYLCIEICYYVTTYVKATSTVLNLCKNLTSFVLSVRY